MTFISYAQNFEDVMLWRALQHVVDGYYIDIGAQDPMVDSVSLAFAERGWHGVSVEPTPHYADRFRQQRPHDTLEQVAIAPDETHIRFFEVPATGLSTADVDIAARYAAEGRELIESMVPAIPLDNLLARHAHRDIHWMKIDVEGLEQAVLESWNTAEVRPWVLVVESTAPMSTTAVHSSWEHLVLAKGYQFAYFDGLNRFYVHHLHADLKALLEAPPNVFDNFVVRPQWDAEQKVESLNEISHKWFIEANALSDALSTASAESAQLTAESAQLTAENRQLHDRTESLQHRINYLIAERDNLSLECDALRNSLSWKVTAPLRGIGSFAASPISFTLQQVLKHSHLSERINGVISRFPSLHARLRSKAITLGFMQEPVLPQPSVATPDTLADLSPRARLIHSSLQQEIARLKG